MELSNAVKLPRSPARKVDILDNNQLQTLFSSIDTTDILSVRDGLILALMLDSGLRQNEVVQLKKNDINLSEHTLRHNFATNYCLDEYALSGSMDIFKLKSIMGHNNIEITMVYMHLAQELIAAKTSISHLDKIKIHL